MSKSFLKQPITPNTWTKTLMKITPVKLFSLYTFAHSFSNTSTVNMFLGIETTSKLVQVLKKCKNVSFEKLYETLCLEIHGYPWSGTKIQILKEKLEDNQVCALTECAKILGFDYEVVSEIDDRKS